MRRVQKGYKHFFDEYDRLERTPPPQGVYAKVLELIDTVLAREILEPAREYLRVNEGMLDRATKANEELSERITLGLIGLGVCGSIGGLLGGWVIAVSLRRSLLDLQNAGSDELHRAAMAANALVDVYANAVAQVLAATGTDAVAVAAIGAHGQTVRHRPGDGPWSGAASCRTRCTTDLRFCRCTDLWHVLGGVQPRAERAGPDAPR